MKINKPQAKNVLQLLKWGSVCATSDWTTGSGRYTKAKAIPPFCARIVKYDADKYPKRIQKEFKRRPYIHAVVAIVDMRGAKRELKRHGLL